MRFTVPGMVSGALASSCYVLLAGQLLLVVWLGLAGRNGLPPLSTAMLAHLFILSWMVAHAFYDLACARAYASTRAPAPGAP